MFSLRFVSVASSSEHAVGKQHLGCFACSCSNKSFAFVRSASLLAPTNLLWRLVGGTNKSGAFVNVASKRDKEAALLRKVWLRRDLKHSVGLTNRRFVRSSNKSGAFLREARVGQGSLAQSLPLFGFRYAKVWLQSSLGPEHESGLQFFSNPDRKSVV